MTDSSAPTAPGWTPHRPRVIGQLRFALLLAAIVIISGQRLRPVPMPGSYHEAAGIGLASAFIVGGIARLRRVPFPTQRIPWVIAWAVGARSFFDGFLRWKAKVAEANFPWDVRLTQLDEFIHGGPAWRLLPSSELVLRILDWAYYVWFPVLSAGILYWAWHPNGLLRARFAAAFVSTWVFLGIALAILFSSSGPIFAPDFTVLPNSSSSAMRDALWSAYSDGEPTSISAMPSLHVAIPVLYGLSVRGWLRATMWTYAALIFAGSVALGWHWAIDGYAATFLVAGIWWLTGRTREAGAGRELGPNAMRKTDTDSRPIPI